jgi:STE24 endopeptidase
LVIGGALLTAVLWIYQELRSTFWLWAWLLFAGFSLFFFMFGTKLILPLFNKLTPVPDGELRSEVERYCASQGYSLGKLFVMDGSKRSTKANAFFTGLGKSKTIVLFDTLLEKLSTKEVVAVLAHEIGHYKRKHTLSMFLLSNLQTFVLFALLGWLLGVEELSTALGASESSFHLSALAFFLLFSPVSMLLGLLNNGLSRRNEYQADDFARETYDEGGSFLREALKKISTDALANLSPHPLYVAVNYTHPPIRERLRNLA